MTHQSLTPEATQFVDQMSTLMATAGRVHTTHELTELAPARVMSFPCAWGTCLPRTNEITRHAVVAEWHDRETSTHYIRVRRSAVEVGECLAYLQAIGHLKLVTVTSAPRHYKAWLWVGPPPVSAARLESMWELTP